MKMLVMKGVYSLQVRLNYYRRDIGLTPLTEFFTHGHNSES